MNPLLALTLTAAVTAAPPADTSTPQIPTPIATQAVALALAETPRRAAPRASATEAALAQPGGDSLKNGAIIGAVVAGAGMGGFIYWLCRALDDTGGNADCAGPSLIWAGIAGAGGAAIGAGVDALFERRPVGALTGKNQPGRIFPVGASIRFKF